MLTLFLEIVYLNLFSITCAVIGKFWFVSVLPGCVTVLSPQVSNETHSKTCLLLYLVYYIFVRGVSKSLNTCSSWNYTCKSEHVYWCIFLCVTIRVHFFAHAIMWKYLTKLSFSSKAWKILLTYHVCCCFEVNVSVSWCRPMVYAGVEKVSSEVTI